MFGGHGGLRNGIGVDFRANSSDSRVIGAMSTSVPVETLVSAYRMATWSSRVIVARNRGIRITHRESDVSVGSRGQHKPSLLTVFASEMVV